MDRLNCIICQDAKPNANWAITLCGHVYHADCLQTWLNKEVNLFPVRTCPDCRAFVLDPELTIIGSADQAAYVEEVLASLVRAVLHVEDVAEDRRRAREDEEKEALRLAQEEEEEEFERVRILEEDARLRLIMAQQEEEVEEEAEMEGLRISEERQRLAEENEREGLRVAKEVAYAYFLMRSSILSDVWMGVGHLEQILESATGEEARNKDHFFHLASSYVRLKDFKESMKYVRRLQELDPGHLQTLDLEKRIEREVKKEVFKRAMIACSTVGTLVALGIAFLMKKR